MGVGSSTKNASIRTDGKLIGFVINKGGVFVGLIGDVVDSKDGKTSPVFMFDNNIEKENLSNIILPEGEFISKINIEQPGDQSVIIVTGTKGSIIDTRWNRPHNLDMNKPGESFEINCDNNDYLHSIKMEAKVYSLGGKASSILITDASNEICKSQGLSLSIKIMGIIFFILFIIIMAVIAKKMMSKPAVSTPVQYAPYIDGY